MIKGAQVQPSGKRSGQKRADGHLGTVSVPFAPVFKAYSQLFSPTQLQVKASTASEPGFQKQELNLGN